MRFGRKRKVMQAAAAALAVVSMLGGLISGGIGNIQVLAAAADPGRTDYSVSGERLVWLQQDTHGIKQLHTLDQANGTSKILTSSSSSKDAPYVNGTVAVWADKGSEPEASLNWDIYSANLETGQQTKLNQQTGEYGNPSTDGAGVVWYERKNYGSMIYHDLVSGAEADLGEGRFPVLAAGNVVFKNARDGGLSLLDVSSGVKRPLVSLGGANAVDWFVFNGSQVLFKQSNGAAGSKYVLLNISDLTAQPVDLTEMKAAGTEYTFMAIGETHAVFQTEVNGVVTLQRVDLTTYAVQPLPALEAGAKLIGISGDKLLYSKNDDSIQSVDLADGTSAAPGTNPDPGTAVKPGTTVPVVTGVKDTRIIGAAGGILSVLNGWARLEISAGTFPDNTTVSLAEATLDNNGLLDASGHKLLKTGSAWQVEAGASFQIPAKLAIRYPDEEPWTTEREKLGIYSFDPATGFWSYIGGVTAAEDGFVQARITASGLYAVMLREAAFTDMTGHWAQQPVEVLAARGIVNGMNGTLYVPKGTLTRAEFTKLLAAALNLQPVHPDKPTFRDVSAASWSYTYVEAAAAAGIVTGEAGLFHGNDPLTREQMMVMLIRAIDKAAGTTTTASASDSLHSQAGLLAFKDNSSISKWARDSVAAAVEKKLVQGSGQLLRPKDSSTRAEAAVIMYKLLAELNLL